jgi:hypothetical protein
MEKRKKNALPLFLLSARTNEIPLYLPAELIAARLVSKAMRHQYRQEDPIVSLYS